MNHPSHFFVAIDPGDCPRCIGCDVRSGSRHAEPPCPDAAPSKCVHNSIARCEQNPAWCTDCHQYIDQQTGKASNAPTLVVQAAVNSLRRIVYGDVVELGWDRDTESYQYPEDIF